MIHEYVSSLVLKWQCLGAANRGPSTAHGTCYTVYRFFANKVHRAPCTEISATKCLPCTVYENLCNKVFTVYENPCNKVLCTVFCVCESLCNRVPCTVYRVPCTQIFLLKLVTSRIRMVHSHYHLPRKSVRRLLEQVMKSSKFY